MIKIYLREKKQCKKCKKYYIEPMPIPFPISGISIGHRRMEIVAGDKKCITIANKDGEWLVDLCNFADYKKVKVNCHDFYLVPKAKFVTINGIRHPIDLNAGQISIIATRFKRGGKNG